MFLFLERALSKKTLPLADGKPWKNVWRVRLLLKPSATCWRESTDLAANSRASVVSRAYRKHLQRFRPRASKAQLFRFLPPSQQLALLVVSLPWILPTVNPARKISRLLIFCFLSLEQTPAWCWTLIHSHQFHLPKLFPANLFTRSTTTEKFETIY